jgi:hypothetical protein
MEQMEERQLLLMAAVLNAASLQNKERYRFRISPSKTLLQPAELADQAAAAGWEQAPAYLLIKPMSPFRT